MLCCLVSGRRSARSTAAIYLARFHLAIKVIGAGQAPAVFGQHLHFWRAIIKKHCGRFNKFINLVSNTGIGL